MLRNVEMKMRKEKQNKTNNYKSFNNVKMNKINTKTIT